MTTTSTPPHTDTSTPAVEVGSVFVASWGYDQTNVDAYVVVGVTSSGKSARVMPCGLYVDSVGQGSIKVTPDPTDIRPWRETRKWSDRRGGYVDIDPNAPKVKRIQVSTWDGTPRITIDESRTAYLWTGQDYHQTAMGWGH